MTASAGLLELLKELMGPLGQISVRRMFGGAGLYCDGQMLALVDQDTLYFKTDEPGRSAFLAEGLGPFTYMTKHGPGTLLSYWRAPERLLDEPEEMLVWARAALEVSRRAAARKKPSGRGVTSRKRALKARKANLRT